MRNWASSESVSPVNIIGNSPGIKHVHDLTTKVARSQSTVLILGESGTGKELIARSIHLQSERSAGPFVPVNCGAIPRDLLESELFGHEKGSFTSAACTRIGRFELADGGTILLDEIGEMPQILQVKLLRVLQERSFERVGGVRTINVDVRIVAATNQDLEAAVKEGRFREDLFYRLNVIPIEVPPLRRRVDDIPLLCSFFVDKYSKRFGRNQITFTDEAARVLAGYSWPGNVRELENTVERLLVLKDDDVVKTSDLPESMTGKTIPEMPDLVDDDVNPFVSGIDLNAALVAYEKRLILHALELHSGIKSQAAKYLDINRTTLIEKMKRLGLS